MSKFIPRTWSEPTNVPGIICFLEFLMKAGNYDESCRAKTWQSMLSAFQNEQEIWKVIWDFTKPTEVSCCSVKYLLSFIRLLGKKKSSIALAENSSIIQQLFFFSSINYQIIRKNTSLLINFYWWKLCTIKDNAIKMNHFKSAL